MVKRHFDVVSVLRCLSVGLAAAALGFHLSVMNRLVLFLVSTFCVSKYYSLEPDHNLTGVKDAQFVIYPTKTSELHQTGIGRVIDSNISPCCLVTPVLISFFSSILTSFLPSFPCM